MVEFLLELLKRFEIKASFQVLVFGFFFQNIAVDLSGKHSIVQLPPKFDQPNYLLVSMFHKNSVLTMMTKNLQKLSW